MTARRIIPAAQLRAGPAIIIVALGPRSVSSTRQPAGLTGLRPSRTTCRHGELSRPNADRRTCNVERLGPRTPDLRNHDGRE